MIRDQLHPDLILFLESVLMAEETFFVFLEGINEPSEMFKGEELMPDETGSDSDRFVVLYNTNIGLGEHGVGLVYDQKYSRATMVLGLEDIDGVVVPVDEHQDMWYPLETVSWAPAIAIYASILISFFEVLTKWIELIRVGKVTTKKQPQHSGNTPEKSDGTSEDESVEAESDRGSDSDSDSSLFNPDAFTEYEPWIWNSYGAQQVASTVASFERLVETIESRMPPEPGSTGLSTASRRPLLSEEALDAAFVPQDIFIRSFLNLARRPAFTRIAPGLVIPVDGAAFAHNQVFTPLMESVAEELDERDSAVVPPVLLFAVCDGSSTVPQTSREQLLDQEEALAAGWSQFVRHDDAPSAIPAGLYSEGVERRDVDSDEEGFRLVLPFVLVARGEGRATSYARKSDGSVMEGGGVASLFQHGHKPFGGEWWRAQRLERLFGRWRELVEMGVWTVGPQGVEGSVDMFQDAETAAGWRNYWLSPDW